MPRPLPFLAALGVLGALGCAPAPEQQPPAAIVARFIHEESAESPTPDRLYTSREVGYSFCRLTRSLPVSTTIIQCRELLGYDPEPGIADQASRCCTLLGF